MIKWLVLSTAFCGALAGCAESPESPEVLVERGHLMESRGRLPEAIDAYGKALARRPDDATIYYDRGVAFGRLGQWKDAIEDYTRAIERDPALAKAYNNRAAAYAQQRDFNRAIADFTKAISLDSKSALTYRNRGLAYHDLGQFNQAIEDDTVAIRLEPDVYDGPFARGNAYLDSSQYQKAIADFDRAVAIDPTRAPAWMNRGEAFRRLGDSKRALADFDKARQLDPELAPPALPKSAAGAQPTPSAELPTGQSESVRARALQVATDFLRAKGFSVALSSPAGPFDLDCEKDGRHLRVEVQAASTERPVLRFTREQIDAAEHSDVPTALIVVGKMVPPTSAGQPFTGGTVVQFVENWKPVHKKLVPVVFEYPL